MAVAGPAFTIREQCKKQIQRETEKETYQEFNYRGHSNPDGLPC